MDFLEASQLLLKNGIRKDATRQEIVKTIKRNKAFLKENQEIMALLDDLTLGIQECIDAANGVIALCQHELSNRPKFQVGDLCRTIKSKRTFSGKDIIGKCVFIADVHAITNEDAVSLFDKFYYSVDGVPHGIWENELELVARGKDIHKES